jgi:hypothetical protein
LQPGRELGTHPVTQILAHFLLQTNDHLCYTVWYTGDYRLGSGDL